VAHDPQLPEVHAYIHMSTYKHGGVHSQREIIQIAGKAETLMLHMPEYLRYYIFIRAPYCLHNAPDTLTMRVIAR